MSRELTCEYRSKIGSDIAMAADTNKTAARSDASTAAIRVDRLRLQPAQIARIDCEIRLVIERAFHDVVADRQNPRTS